MLRGRNQKLPGEKRRNAMKNACLMFAILFAATAFAADGKTVSYKSGDETIQGLICTPPGKGPFPALIVIHEYRGD
jgi:hypothetical protein